MRITKLQRIISQFCLTIAVLAVPALMAVSTPANSACNPGDLSIGGGINCAAPSSSSQTGLFGTNSLFQKVANAIIFITGAVAVIMVIIGGFRYVLSSGNPQATAGAKDTILYAVIGVVVAALAYAIVNFVIVRLSG
jgi:hypothetical protein